MSNPMHEQVVRMIVDAVVESVNGFADQMESGEIPMMTGPEALRTFAAQVNLSLIMREGT